MEIVMERHIIGLLLLWHTRQYLRDCSCGTEPCTWEMNGKGLVGELRARFDNNAYDFFFF